MQDIPQGNVVPAGKVRRREHLAGERVERLATLTPTRAMRLCALSIAEGVNEEILQHRLGPGGGVGGPFLAVESRLFAVAADHRGGLGAAHIPTRIDRFVALVIRPDYTPRRCF